MKGEAVSSIAGTEFVQNGKGDLVNRVAAFFASEFNGKAVSPVLGEVILDRRGVKDSLSHGIGRVKAAAYAAVRDVIEKGLVFDSQDNWKGRGADTFVIAAPIKIGATDYICEVIVQRNRESGRQAFYLHEVNIKEKIAGAIETSTREAAPATTAAPVRSILAQRLLEVKQNAENVSQVVDENGEPLVVAHSTDAEFTVFRDMQKNDAGWLGAGFYFFGDRSLDGQYGRNVMECFLNVREPYFISDEERDRLAESDDAGTSAEFSEEIRGEGYDGVYYNGDLNREWAVFSPSQVKSATDNAGTFSGSNPDIRYSISGLYTGSAADYAERVPVLDKDGNVTGYRIDNAPSLQYVGSGEGSQVYGWGLYASDVRGVAEGYAAQMVKSKHNRPSVKINGKEYVQGRYDETIEPWMQVFLNHAFSATAWMRGKDFRKKLLASARQSLKLAEKGAKSDPETFGELVEANKKCIDFISDSKNKIEFHDNASIYEQTFFTDRADGEETERHLLKWYEEVPRDTFDRIVSALKEEGRWGERDGGRDILGRPETIYGTLYGAMRHSGGEWTGGDVYELVRAQLGADENHGAREASEWLAAHGIDGVKYPVDSFGGKGVKDGDSAGWNYVTFRDDNIRVDHKWSDGVQRYSVTTRVYNPEAKVRIVDGTIEPNFKNLTAREIRDYLRDKYMGREITIDADGTLVEFDDYGLRSAMKKRGKHRRALHVLDRLVKNSHYTRFEENDGQEKHKGLVGQFVYTAALRLSDGVYGVELKLDIPKSDPENTYFKGQTLRTKIADAVLSVQPKSTSTNEASAAETIRLGDIVQTPGILPQPASEVNPPRASVAPVPSANYPIILNRA